MSLLPAITDPATPIMDDWPREDDNELVIQAKAYARTIMARYDESHSFDHVLRVVSLARHIHLHTAPSSPPRDPLAVLLAALLHDVADRKYAATALPDEEAEVRAVLLRLGAPAELAAKVAAVCAGVSYSGEARDPGLAAARLAAHPELAVVQDADRIDALGAVGIGRVFAYGAVKTTRGLDGSVAHFEDKLLKLERMCKTDVGREIARRRTERLLLFKSWWDEETGLGYAIANGTVSDSIVADDDATPAFT